VAISETAPARDSAQLKDSALAFAASPWALVAVLAVALIAYAPSLTGWFDGDDFWFLRGAHEHGLWRYTFDSFDPRLTDPSNEFNRYRPLYPIAWRWQYELFGMHAFAYHAVVVAAHLACCVLVWWIARRLLRADWTATLATAIFALHPVNAGTVAWISGNRVFSTLPFLAALLLFMRLLDRTSERRGLALAGSVLCYVIAVLMHSSTIVLLPVLVAYGFGLAGEPREALRIRNWLIYAPFAVIAAGLTIVQLYVRHHLNFDGDFRFGWHQYSIYGQYLALLLVPPDPGEFHNGISDLLSFLRGAGALLFIGAMIATVATRPVRRIALFAAVWMLLSLLPDSTLVFAVSGRVLYLATVPFAIFAVAMLMWAIEAAERARVDIRSVAIIVAAAALIASVALTADRANKVTERSEDSHRFAMALRDEGPDVPAGGVLYLDEVPASLTFAPTWATSLAALYYPGHEIQRLNASSRPRPNDRVFRYEP
jgi:hypothetical protein